MSKARMGSWVRCLPLLIAATAPLAAQAHDGWYVGLEGGGNWMDAQKFRIYNYDALLSNVPDGTRIGSASFDPGWLGGLTFGYGFGNGFRGELEVAYRQNDFKSLTRDPIGPFTNGGHTKNVDGNENLTSGMLNVWYDFLPDASWHPYLGGGLGAGRLAIDDARWDDNELRDRADTQFAWQLGAGVNFDLNPHWVASLDYRYVKLDGGNKFDLVDNEPNSYVESDYDTHSVMLSVRYHFGAEPAPVHQVSEPVAVVPVDEAPVLPPPPPPPVCRQPEAGESLSLDGCKAGDTLVLRGVNFEFDKATLTLNAKALLDQVADELSKHPDIKVEIDGHTDAKGADAYNMKLSQRRADAVKTYLVEKNVAAERMTTKGYGETMPVADNSTDEGREQNRRVELKITDGGDGAATETVAPPLTLSETPEPRPEPVDPLTAN